jgi:hypothetical protein
MTKWSQERALGSPGVLFHKAREPQPPFRARPRLGAGIARAGLLCPQDRKSL